MDSGGGDGDVIFRLTILVQFQKFLSSSRRLLGSLPVCNEGSVKEHLLAERERERERERESTFEQGEDRRGSPI